MPIGRSFGASITGGTVVRDAASPLNGRYVFGDFAFGMLWVDAQTYVNAVIQERRKTAMLMRAVENDMVGNLDDFGHVSFFVTSAIGRYFAFVIITGKARFPKTGAADTIKIVANDRRDFPHRKSLHRA